MSSFTVQMANVVVTGANRGIGLAMIKEFLKDKSIANVFAAHRNTADTKALRSIKDARLHLLEMDILYDEEIYDSMKKVEAIVGNKGVDILVNNAGVMYDYDTDGNVLRKLMCLQMESNAASHLVVTQTFLPLLRMAARTGGKALVINLTGSLASITNCKGKTARNATLYQMSKAALNMMSRSLGMDLKGDGIIVVSLCPGKVKTETGGNDAEITAEQSAKILVEDMTAKIGLEHAAGYFDRSLKPIPF